MPDQPSNHKKPESDPDKNPLSPESKLDVRGDELGGPKGQEPTRYGDWENKGICWDF